MTFDDFLLSNETNFYGEKNTLIKVKYNDNVFFLYSSQYGDLEYGSSLEYYGLFDKIHNSLYGYDDYYNSNYNSELKSNYYKGTLGNQSEKMINDATKLLNDYVKENSNKLKELAKPIFDKYISYENNHNNIKYTAITNYIYHEKPEDYKFSISECDLNSKQTVKKILMEYIQFPEKTVEEIYKEYINNSEKSTIFHSASVDMPNIDVTIKESIGLKLLENDFKNEIIMKLKSNPNNTYVKKHNIIGSINKVEAQNLTITIKHQNKLLTFKYPKNLLHQLDFYSWYIPDLKARDIVDEWYIDVYANEKNDLFIKEITSIEYRKQILYEDKELLKEDNFLLENNQEHDIVDDMFD